MSETTNATRVLAARKVAFTLATYAPSDFTAEECAAKLGAPEAEVFKTLVGKGDRTGHLAAVIPTDARLSLKKLARASGNKTVALVSVEEMEKLTGYVKGGCSPFWMRRQIPVFVHESAAGRPRVFCSAGRRGVQLVLAGDDLVAASGGRAADLVEDGAE